MREVKYQEGHRRTKGNKEKAAKKDPMERVTSLKE